jgi:hypothetical protein
MPIVDVAKGIDPVVEADEAEVEATSRADSFSLSLHGFYVARPD